jgi:uncharacterized protein with HEPN domain
MAASKSPRARLLHIRDEIEGVAASVKELSFEQYQGSYIHRRAVKRAAQIVSEAAKVLPKNFLAKYQEAPWASIIGIGNVLRPTNIKGSTIGCSGKSRQFIFRLWSR